MIGGLALALVLAPVEQTSGPAFNTARRVLPTCPGGSRLLAGRADPTFWQPQSSAIAVHRAVRAPIRADLRIAPVTVLLLISGGHLYETQSSIVATRTQQGRWTLDTVSRIQHWTSVDTWEWNPPHRFTRLATSDEAARIDAILADPCFAAEPRHMTRLASDPPPWGPLRWTLEVMPGGRRDVIRGEAPAQGLTLELLRLMLPPDKR